MLCLTSLNLKRLTLNLIENLLDLISSKAIRFPSKINAQAGRKNKSKKFLFY
jgi:hypothetical protein